jgi:hypothetical protein
MKQVWKYPLKDGAGMHHMYIPKGGNILTVDFQGTSPFVWILIDPEEKDEDGIYIGYFGTGWDMAEGLRYIVTRQLNGYVWHFFWRES